MSDPQPAGRMRPSLSFSCSISSLNNATCPNFDNVQYDICGAVVLSITLSRLYIVLGDFHTSTDTLVHVLKTFY